MLSEELGLQKLLEGREGRPCSGSTRQFVPPCHVMSCQSRRPVSRFPLLCVLLACTVGLPGLCGTRGSGAATELRSLSRCAFFLASSLHYSKYVTLSHGFRDMFEIVFGCSLPLLQLVSTNT